jgi:hypothetical protein
MSLWARLGRWRQKGKGVEATESLIDPDSAIAPLPSEPLWHYTTAAGLLGILRNNDESAGPDRYNPVLHATAAQFLNDQRELTLGLGLMKEFLEIYADRQLFDHNPDAKTFIGAVCEAIQSIIDRTYPHYVHCSTISFSTQCDSLSQWRAYGQGTGGFAIGFDPSKFPRSHPLARQGGIGLQKVTYVTDTLEQPLLDAFNLFVAQALHDSPAEKPTDSAVNKAVQRLAYPAASVKHIGFCDELEWRFVEPGFGLKRGDPNKPDFRIGAAGLGPYRPVALPADAVTGVWVGPGQYQYENYLAAQSMLYRYGYIEASHNVQRSSTPFR